MTIRSQGIRPMQSICCMTELVISEEAERYSEKRALYCELKDMDFKSWFDKSSTDYLTSHFISHFLYQYNDNESVLLKL